MLTGRQQHLAMGQGDALRIDPRYGPFGAARDAGDAAQAALAALTPPGGQVWVVEAEEWPAPPGLRVLHTAPLLQMIAPKPQPMQPGDEAAVLLGDADAAEMTALALATEPGPWGELTQRYGAFYGLRDDAGRLMAMAGERMLPGVGLCEVSGVCTWPEFQGRGLAGSLIRRVMAGITARGEVPFLHSYAGNTRAIGLYESLGFTARRSMVATILDKPQ